MKRKDMMNLNNNSPAKNFALSLLAVLPLVAGTFSTSTIAAPTAVSEQKATTALNQYLTRLKSLEADFVQTTQLQNAKTVKAKPSSLNQGLRNSHLNQKFTGTMQVKRPGQFRWETTSPSKQLIVASDETVWIYDPDLEQAVRQKLDEQVSNTPALLLSGQTSNIMKSFRVTQPNAQEAYFVLYPKSEDGVFDSLGMRFSNNLPTQMVLKDSLGQQTTINFSNVKLNPTLNSSAFNFVPPKGTDVIDQ